MKERPILFNGEMVRAILDGRKTQTRRPVKPQPVFVNSLGIPFFAMGGGPVDYRNAPLGTIGDRLWVRETWGLMSYHDTTYWCGYSIKDVSEAELREQFLVEHAANWNLPNESAYWRPSIHMPRWASRITLEITGVRVERVQEISDDDAESEGVDLRRMCGCVEGCATCDDRSPSEVFRDLWQSIYANWDANPWVWVYQIRRIKP